MSQSWTAGPELDESEYAVYSHPLRVPRPRAWTNLDMALQVHLFLCLYTLGFGLLSAWALR